MTAIARAHRPRCHRRIGGLLVSFDIIQIIPRPKRDDAQAGFPVVAFRSARQHPATDPADAAPGKRARSINQAA